MDIDFERFEFHVCTQLRGWWRIRICPSDVSTNTCKQGEWNTSVELEFGNYSHPHAQKRAKKTLQSCLYKPHPLLPFIPSHAIDPPQLLHRPAKTPLRPEKTSTCNNMHASSF